MGMFLLPPYDSLQSENVTQIESFVHKYFCFQCSEFVICGAIGLFSMGMIYYKYLEDKETKAHTNKPYKEYYTVYRPNDPRIQRLRQEWFQNGAPPMTSAKIN